MAVSYTHLGSEAHRDALCNLRIELAQIGVGRGLDGDGLFCDQIFHSEAASAGVDGDNGARDVAEGARDNFFGGNVVSIGAAIAARGHLIAGLDGGEGRGLGFGELHGIGGVAANDRVRGGVDGDGAICSSDGYGSGGRVHGLDQPAYAATRPVRLLLLLLRGDVALLVHDDDGGSGRIAGDDHELSLIHI